VLRYQFVLTFGANIVNCSKYLLSVSLNSADLYAIIVRYICKVRTTLHSARFSGRDKEPVRNESSQCTTRQHTAAAGKPSEARRNDTKWYVETSERSVNKRNYILTIIVNTDIQFGN